MTKRSEIAAMLAYPIMYYGELDVNRSSRILFKEGYEQAEEDHREEIASIKAKLWQDGYDDGHKKAEKEFALTWKDIPIIIGLCEQVKTEWWFRDMKGIGTQKHFEEVLRRFNEQRKK